MHACSHLMSACTIYQGSCDFARELKIEDADVKDDVKMA